MPKQQRRGYVPEDDREFNEEALTVLAKAGRDVCYLLNRGYRIEGAVTFVCNHYMLSQRQRIALMRFAASDEAVKSRKAKEITEDDCEGRTFSIDGFNTIITLEVALSASPVILGRDGCFRDLAGLRGTYHPIDKTVKAINMIGEFLENRKAAKAVFYFDAPVSNSGRLSVLVKEELGKYPFLTEVYCINEVDRVLKGLECVVTADFAILEQAKSYFNLNRYLLEGISDLWLVDFFR